MSGGAEGDRLRRCVVAGGAGAVGTMFADLLAGSGADVRVVDTAPPPGHAGLPEDVRPSGDGPAIRFVPGDVTAPDERVSAELARADLVLLAVPEPVALAAIPVVTAAMRPGTLLAETLSVQSRVAAVVEKTPRGVQAVGLNPMFAPSLGLAGRPVAVVPLRDGPLVTELLRLVAGGGGRIVRLTADGHDRLTAATQALTHATALAFGLALTELDVDAAALTELAPPPHATMLALLARISTGQPAVYWDIQAANPYAGAARAALARGVDRLAMAADGGDEPGFADSLRQARDFLGTELGTYRHTCARVFDSVSVAGGERETRPQDAGGEETGAEQAGPGGGGGA